MQLKPKIEEPSENRGDREKLLDVLSYLQQGYLLSILEGSLKPNWYAAPDAARPQVRTVADRIRYDMKTAIDMALQMSRRYPDSDGIAYLVRNIELTCLDLKRHIFSVPSAGR